MPGLLTGATRYARLLSSGFWPRRLGFGMLLLAAVVGLSVTVLAGQGSTQALFIDTEGRVGIGEDKPSHKLHVKAPDAVGLFESSTNQAYLKFSTTEGLDNRVEIANRPGGRLALWVAGGGDALNITRNGNVGIGADPSHKLHVKAPDAVGLFESSTNQAYLKFSTTEGLDNRVEIANRPGGRLALWVAGGGDALNITRNGNVGIGADPSHKLHVKAPDAVGLFESSTNQAYLKFSTTEGLDNRVEIANRPGGRLALWVVGGGDALNITRNGNVGIGEDNPSHKLHVAGGKAYFDDAIYVKGGLKFWWGDDGVWKGIENTYSGLAKLTNTSAPSDKRFKTDLHPISSTLEKIGQLRGVTYRWNQEALDYFTRHVAHTISAGPEATEAQNRQLWQAEKAKIEAQLAGAQLGLIAQEVESVVPEVVTTDAAGYKAIKYPQLTALLIEAVKEQQARIAAQRADIARLQASNTALQAQVQELQALSAAAQATQAELKDMRAQLARLGAAVLELTASQEASTANVGHLITPRQ